MDEFEAHTRRIVADFRGGTLAETEARGRLAGEFIRSGVARTAVRRFDGRNGRLPMALQTAADLEVRLNDLVIDRTLDGGHRSSFRFVPNATYSGWARNFCTTATLNIARDMRIASQRQSLVDDFDQPATTGAGRRRSRSVRGAFGARSGEGLGGEEGALRVSRAMDRLEESKRARGTARLQADAACLLILTETPQLCRLPRCERRRLAEHVATDPDAGYRALRRLVEEGAPDSQLGRLFDGWTIDEAERFLELGNQERRRRSVMTVVRAALADYPRPRRSAMKELETLLAGFREGRCWKQLSARLAATFIDSECEAVSALSTAPNSDARVAEHSRNTVEYPDILNEAAAVMNCSPRALEGILVRFALETRVVEAPPQRVRAAS